MINLSSKPTRKIGDISDIPSLLTTIAEHEYFHTREMKYLQFLTYINSDNVRFLDAVTLNGWDKGKIWWKEKIEKEYKDVKWLHDTYETSFAQFNDNQREMILHGIMTGLSRF